MYFYHPAGKSPNINHLLLVLQSLPLAYVLLLVHLSQHSAA